MPIDETLRAQIDLQLTHLDNLRRRGSEIGDLLERNPNDSTAISTARAWQEECGVTVNQLSGGSKAHWLARSFSEAFLLRSADGRAVEGAAPSEIVSRLIGVIEQAAAALAGLGDAAKLAASAGSSSEASPDLPPPHQFDFVHNPELRPIVEQAYRDSRLAVEQGNYGNALRISCGILEAIVTDALENKGLGALAVSGAPAGRIADWSFETRLAVAERAGLIRGGCARLPTAARTYRDHHPEPDDEPGSDNKISERDARQTGQVLRVVMKDLDPGR